MKKQRLSELKYGLMFIASLKSGGYAAIEEWNQREREKP